MKYPSKVNVIILVMFLLAQFIGLAVITSYDNYFGKGAEEEIRTGKIVQPEISVVRETVPPEIELKEPIDIVRIISSIIVALIIAIALFFLLSKVRITIILKIWFAVVVFICLSLAFTLFLYPYLSTSIFKVFGKKVALAEVIAIPLALILTFYKIVRRNIFVHNFTELFIYPGLAIIFLPLLNVIAAAILLVIISIYDMIAVWGRSKFMIKMAKFQMHHLKVFAGFFLPFVSPKDKVKIQRLKVMEKRRKEKEKKMKKKGKKLRKRKEKKIKVRVNLAVLGGGDVAFPLIFAGTILFAYGLAPAIITILSTTLALTLLLTFSEKGKFYPAMPFLSAGCFLGLVLTLLLL
ncbi:MAG: hypothetical protein IB618_04070 [Candidatus Pacearchaeota archaeon]|nr:MAG: hypothetical protein IB618_04070 [Candidatus Pacearchaeota archaeon]